MRGRALPVAGISFENHAIRALERYPKRAGAENPFLLRRVGRRSGNNGCPRVGQESREDRERLEKLEGHLALGASLNPSDLRRRSLEVLGNSANRAEGGGESFPGEPDRSLQRGFDGWRREGGPVGELNSPAQAQANSLAAVLGRPPLAEQRDQVPLRIGRYERLEDVRQDLVVLDDLTG